MKRVDVELIAAVMKMGFEYVFILFFVKPSWLLNAKYHDQQYPMRKKNRWPVMGMFEMLCFRMSGAPFTNMDQL